MKHVPACWPTSTTYLCLELGCAQQTVDTYLPSAAPIWSGSTGRRKDESTAVRSSSDRPACVDRKLEDLDERTTPRA